MNIQFTYCVWGDDLYCRSLHVYLLSDIIFLVCRSEIIMQTGVLFVDVWMAFLHVCKVTHIWYVRVCISAQWCSVSSFCHQSLSVPVLQWRVHRRVRVLGPNIFKAFKALYNSQTLLRDLFCAFRICLNESPGYHRIALHIKRYWCWICSFCDHHTLNRPQLCWAEGLSFRMWTYKHR